MGESYGTKNYEESGGEKWVVGGILDIITGGFFKIAGVVVSATAAQLNLLVGAIAGVVVAGKAVIYDAAGKVAVSSATPAAAGTTIADATALTAAINYVTAADGSKGVKLPVAVLNSVVTVINSDTSNDLLCYPVAASQINGLGASNPITITPGQSVTFVARSITLWNSATATDTITGLNATAAEINKAADLSAQIQTITASGAQAITAGVSQVYLNEATTAIAATIADSAAHQGLFFIKAGLEPAGGQDHTVTLTSGTWNGTNNVATFADIADALTIMFDAAGNGTVIVNTGSVAFS